MLSLNLQKKIRSLYASYALGRDTVLTCKSNIWTLEVLIRNQFVATYIGTYWYLSKTHQISQHSFLASISNKFRAPLYWQSHNNLYNGFTNLISAADNLLMWLAIRIAWKTALAFNMNINNANKLSFITYSICNTFSGGWKRDLP